MDEPQVTRRYTEEYAPPTGASIRLGRGSTYQVTVPAGWKIEAATYIGGNWIYILTTPAMPCDGGDAL